MNPQTDPPTGPVPPMRMSGAAGGPTPAQGQGYPPAPQGQGYPPASQAQPAPAPQNGSFLSLLLIGAAVAVMLGVYGRLHEGTGYAINLAGFSSGLYVKSWLATVSVLLAVVQVISAMIMYGKLTAVAPPWIGALHRWSGRAAILVSVPVALHCLYAVGFKYDDTRLLVHSVAGCLFYGAFTTKMLGLTRSGLPSWSLPFIGGIVFTVLVVLWLTSSVWLFSTQGLKF